MFYREIFRTLGNYLLYFTLILCVPFSVSIYYQFIAIPGEFPQQNSSLAFFETIFITLIVAFIFRWIGRKATGTFYRKESVILAVSIWIVSASLGSLPYYLTDTLKNPIDAYFEAMSGFTTTGASLLTPKKYDLETGKEIQIVYEDPHVPGVQYHYYGTVTPIRNPDSGEIIAEGIEAVGKGLLFWRSFTQWLGGMGIVVLFLAVLPALGVGGKLLYQNEMPGPVKDNLTPRIRDTASLLWKLYLGLSIIQIILLLWTNEHMPIFDAVCITFSTLSTGGFTVTNESIASYSNIATEWIIMIFMLLGSINFTLYFFILRGKIFKIYSKDFFLFLLSVLIGACLITSYIVHLHTVSLTGLSETYDWTTSIRKGFFQAVSAQTSTGFTTANYSHWPFPSQMFMLLLMFFGGMAGATCGGIKSTRFFMLYKIVVHRLESIFRPETVRHMKIDYTEITFERSNTLFTFFIIALFSTILGTVLFVLDNIDPETSLGLLTCMMNNIGMSFRGAGPSYAFNFMPDFSKFLSVFWMLFGRLEFFAILALFFPSFWKKS